MRIRLLLAAVAALFLCCAADAAVVVSGPAKASRMERLAALEVQRYVYARTGALPGIATRASGERIVVARKDRAMLPGAVARAAKGLKPQEYVIKTTGSGGRRTWWIVGGDDVGVLYGAYRFAEKLGVRFYLHGDVIPDKKLARLPDVNETGKPIFSIRGIQPFHDFTEGPDWWNTDDYLAYISQLAKMRMNFIGLHTYPEGMAEPCVWIGTSSDVDAKGRVQFSYPSHWANTALDKFWGYAATPTSQYCSGASLLFPQEKYGPDVMGGVLPDPKTPQQCNAVFDNTANMFRTAFAYARSIGVKTCVGTETPITIPEIVRTRLRQQGKNPSDPNVVQEVYKGMFSRIARAYPVDYYWLWTPEGWTATGNTDANMKAVVQDTQCALGALDALGNPFTLATCGWVLGPTQDRAALDSVLPKQCPMSCINRSVGHAPVEPAFGRISGRPKWAIPWMENDPALTGPQPWVGRMRFDAADAKRLGCTGLLGIHWRTKAMAENVSALAAAGWDQSWVSPGFASSQTIAERAVGPIGGQLATYPSPVEGTDDDPVYQSVRYNMDGYRLTVPNGTYTVRLKFNEPHYSDAGKRVFGVKLQGKLVIDQLDMIAKVGKNVALDYTYPDIKVDAAMLRIDFVREVEFPCIAGIVIDGQTAGGLHYVRKINCGGAAYKDYEADNNQLADKVDQRSMPVEGFYIDFARASFGDAVARDAGRIMARIDGRGLPEPVGWIGGPGGLAPDRQPWDEVKKRWAFVDQFSALRSDIRSPGDLARFDYWMNTYRYAKTLAQLGCVRGELDIKVEEMAAAVSPTAKLELVSQAVDLRTRLSRLWEQMMTYQLLATDTPGEMGTIDNLERHSRRQMGFLTLHDELLAKTLGAPLPKEIELSSAYTGGPRIIVPTVRGQVRVGESMRVKAIVLNNERPSSAALYWRPLGGGQYHKVGLRHIGRAVYEAQLPPANGSFEYYIAAQTHDAKLVWPAGGARVAQTVVVW